jgi:hypothetical protein
MSLPTSWIERIFTKLTLAYGRDFLGRWEGIPIAEVKTDWANCLAGFGDHPEAIGFALSNLPDSRPPTAQEFRAICRQAPQMQRELLEAKKADYTIVAEQLKKMGLSVTASQSDTERNHKAWAERLKARHEAGETLSLVQIKSYKTALDLVEA